MYALAGCSRFIFKFVDITQIILKSNLLSQIRGWVVALRDRIHMELRHTIDLSNYVVKLGK